VGEDLRIRERINRFFAQDKKLWKCGIGENSKRERFNERMTTSLELLERLHRGEWERRKLRIGIRKKAGLNTACCRLKILESSKLKLKNV